MSATGKRPFARAKTLISFPAARSEGLLVETVGDETVIYDLDSKEAHCLKPLAAAVFTHADGRRSVEEIATLAGESLREPVTEAQVQDAIAQLEACALLEASALVDTPLTLRNGLSRRQMVGKSALAAGSLAGASLITSILAPAAGATAASLIPPGCAGCGGNPDCATAPTDTGNQGHCCQKADNNANCNRFCCVGKDNSCHACVVNGQTFCTVSAFQIGGCPDPATCPMGTCCSPTTTTCP